METHLTKATGTATRTLQIHTKQKTGPVWWSSKNRRFAAKNSESVLKMEHGVLKIEIVLGEGFSTIGVRHRVQQPPNGCNCSKEWRKQSNKAKWVRRSKEINNNFISQVDSEFTTSKSTNDPI